MKELTRQKLAVTVMMLDRLRQEEPEDYAEAVQFLALRFPADLPAATETAPQGAPEPLDENWLATRRPAGGR